MIIRFGIDEKSLYRGVINDYKRGQSATVHTPLNQSIDPEKWRKDIYSFINNYPSLKVSSLSPELVDKCNIKTTSKAKTRLIKFYCFDKLLLDGKPFSTNASFAIYVKEEIDEKIHHRDGTLTDNPHFGRQKLHYPISFKYDSGEYSIDNDKVLDTIMEINGGFAFMVNQFEIDTEKRSLNFITTMIGLKGEVLLSSVFRRKKGKGQKLLMTEDNTIPRIQDYIDTGGKALTKEENRKFFETLKKIDKARRRSGRLGEDYVFKNLERVLGHKVENPVHVSKKYPLSPYDIEYELNGEKKYLEVKSTSGTKKVFFMSKGERKFMDKYETDYTLILVVNVKSRTKTNYKYTREQIMSPTVMTQDIPDMKFTVIK